MRFHKIKIENLNSLAGKHEVDLDASLAGAGLFLIHGPTGSGKSTILDAICLALYGKTPRFDDKVKQKTVDIDGLSPNDPSLVMTRGTASCLAEVELSMTGLDGRLRRYRASWSTRRARDKADGTFQTPKRRLEVLEASSDWSVLVDGSKKTDIDEKFGHMLQGLSFDDFQRTTLLAQFAFRQFLEAEEKQRGELLARMTSGGHFEDIGRRAAERRKAVEDELKRLDLELGGKATLSEAEVEVKRLRLVELEQAVTELEAALDGLTARRQLWTGLVEARDALTTAEGERRAVADERASKAGELAALAADRSVTPARLALVEARKCHGIFVLAEDAAARSEAARLAVAERRERVVVERAAASEMRTEVEARLVAQAPELTLAEADWQAWRQAREASEAAKAAFGTREAALVAAEARVVGAAARESQALAQQALTEEELAAIPRREAVTRELSALEQALDLQKRQWSELDALKARLVELRTQREALVTSHERRLAARAPLEEALATATREVAEAEAAMAALCGGEAPEVASQLRAQQDGEARATLERLDALDKARLDAERLAQAVVTALGEAALARSKEAAEVSRVALLEAEERQLEDAQEAARQEAELLGRILHLVDEREVLEAGEPCPLCGSADHPYAEDPASAPDSAEYRARADAADARRAELGTRIGATRTALGSGRRALPDLKARAAGHDERARGLQAERDALLHKIAQSCAELGLGEGEASAPRREQAQELGRRAREEAAAITRLGDGLRKARRTLDAARQRHEAEAEALHQGALELGKVDASIGGEDARAAALGAQFEEARSALEARLVALDINTPKVITGVQEARRRVELARTLLERAEDEGRVLQQATTALAQVLAERDTARAEVTRTRAEHEAAAAQLALASASAQAHFEGRNPAEVRAELEGAVATARKADEVAAKALATIETELSAAQATAAARAETSRLDAEALARAREVLAAQCAACGVAGEDEVAARSLDEATRVALTALEERLAHRATAAQAKVDAAAETLAGAETRLHEAGEVGEVGEAAARVSALDAERKEKGEARSALDQELGALRAELLHNEAERAKKAELQQKREALKDDFEQWKMVADLIGTDKGRVFAELAQALNLRAVIERANARLAGFMERYALTQVVSEQGAPRLDFLVVDRFQDDAKRSTKSLSGGESFIVSLALALGLADLRSSRLRIETLLIDEGFGSLDGKTLRDVLAALSALQAVSGAQIGLISHVDAMKEAIPAQIEVVPLGDGRSIVKVHS